MRPSQQFVGIDLAWHAKAKTGIAVVDERGRLVASSSMVSNDELDTWLDEHALRPVVAAIDAPLIVPNETGQRTPETLVSRAFGRYDAGCHTSNRSRPFMNPPRAAAVASSRGWTIDLGSRGTDDRPVVIEVYPHPAMIGLFRLGRVLHYKSKYLVAERLAAFRDLRVHLESIAELKLHTSARWATLMSVLDRSPRQVDLDLIEDEIDAILCAHLAWLWHHRPSALVVYGGAEDGFIVAPPPPTHPAAERITSVRGRGAWRCSVDVVGRPTGYAGGAKEQAWKDAVRRSLRGQVAAPLQARLRVDVHFRLEPSQAERTAPDLDNLLKSTVDALDGILSPRPIAGRPQADDERIDEIRATKRIAGVSERPGASITILTISGASSGQDRVAPD